MCTETAVNIGYSCRLLTDDIDETFTVDGESHDAVLSQLTNAAAVIQNKQSPASATDSGGMIVTNDGDGQYVVKTVSNGSLAKLQLSVSIRDGQNTSVSFRDGPNTSDEMGQYALVISGHSLVSTSPILIFICTLFLYYYYKHSLNFKQYMSQISVL